MRLRRENHLIDIAFGEVEGTITGSEERIRIAEYRAMKDALAGLRDIPEHQLSTERLREALLHRGLSRPRRFAWEKLGYFGTAAVLFGVAFVLGRHIKSAPVAHVWQDPPAKSWIRTVPTPKFDSHTSSDRDNAGAGGALHTLVASKPGPLRIHRHPVSSLHPIYNAPLATIDGNTQGLKSSLTYANHSEISDANAGQNEAVLVIGAQSDAQTGLASAQEVTGTNALVGG